MSEPEQLEYGYEICARYHLNHLSTGDYIEMGQRYTVADMTVYCNENRSRQGLYARPPCSSACAMARDRSWRRNRRNHGRSETFSGGLGYAKRSSSTIGWMFPTKVQISR